MMSVAATGPSVEWNLANDSNNLVNFRYGVGHMRQGNAQSKKRHNPRNKWKPQRRTGPSREEKVMNQNIMASKTQLPLLFLAQPHAFRLERYPPL